MRGYFVIILTFAAGVAFATLGSIVGSFSGPDTTLRGVGRSTAYLYVIGLSAPNLVYRCNPTSGSVFGSWATPYPTWNRGLAETWGCARYFGKKLNAPWAYIPAYMHVLCGDPELSVWTADPDELDLDVEVKDGGDGNYNIEVTVSDKNTAGPVYLANVCLHAPGDAYLLNLSNEAGRCDFVVPEGASGKITATKHNWVPAWESFVAE